MKGVGCRGGERRPRQALEGVEGGRATGWLQGPPRRGDLSRG